MYKCNECGKQFKECHRVVDGDLEKDIAVCPYCDSKWIKEIGKFYKHNIEQSQHEHAIRFTKAGQQNIIPVLAENQILHLVDIAERGLPDCYTSFKDFLYDFWPDFSWTPKKSIPEVEVVLADPRFKKIVPVLEETWGVDMEKELQDGIDEFKAKEI